MNGENARIDSISSPKNSTRSGSRPVVGKTSTMPAAHGELAALVDALDARVARERERLGERLDADSPPGAKLERLRPLAARRQPLRERERGRAHEPPAGEDVERACPLADEVRRRLEPGVPADAAARQEPDARLAEEPACGLGGVARVGVLRQHADERPRPSRSCSDASTSGSAGSETRARAGSASAKAASASASTSSRTKACRTGCRGSDGP